MAPAQLLAPQPTPEVRPSLSHACPQLHAAALGCAWCPGFGLADPAAQRGMLVAPPLTPRKERVWVLAEFFKGRHPHVSARQPLLPNHQGTQTNATPAPRVGELFPTASCPPTHNLQASMCASVSLIAG